MNKRLDFLLEEIQEHDFNVQQEDGNIYLISNFSPCGQDCNASIDTEDDAERFVENIREYANYFDVSYETYLWLDDTGHGRNGAPYDMKDVYEDMQWWKDSLEELANALENALNEYDNSQTDVDNGEVVEESDDEEYVMEEKILKVGDRVKVNAKWRTELVQGLVGGKTGTVEKIHHYIQLTYDVKFDEPYTFMGEEVYKGNYCQQELEIIE